MPRPGDSSRGCPCNRFLNPDRGTRSTSRDWTPGGLPDQQRQTLSSRERRATHGIYGRPYGTGEYRSTSRGAGGRRGANWFMLVHHPFMPMTTDLDSKDREKKEFFELANRLVNSSDPSEQARMKEELARRTFGE